NTSLHYLDGSITQRLPEVIHYLSPDFNIYRNLPCCRRCRNGPDHNNLTFYGISYRQVFETNIQNRIYRGIGYMNIDRFFRWQNIAVVNKLVTCLLVYVTKHLINGNLVSVNGYRLRKAACIERKGVKQQKEKKGSTLKNQGND